MSFSDISDRIKILKELNETCDRMNIGLQEFAPGHFRLTGAKRTLDYWPLSPSKTVWYKKHPTDKKGVTLHGKDVSNACVLAGRRNVSVAEAIARGATGLAEMLLGKEVLANTRATKILEIKETATDSAAPWAVQTVGRAIGCTPNPQIPWAESAKKEVTDDRTSLLIKLANAERNRDDFKTQMRAFAKQCDEADAKLVDANAKIKELQDANAKLTEKVIAEQFDAHEARQALASNRRVMELQKKELGEKQISVEMLNVQVDAACKEVMFLRDELVLANAFFAGIENEIRKAREAKG